MTANDNAQTPATPATPPAAPVEIWSGKGKNHENFPVGSLLIRARLRRHVHAFYNFARNADDIADHPTLAPAEKISRLDYMEAVLTGAITGPEAETSAPSATALRLSLAQSGISAIHARELLVAFRQDARQNRYQSWDELLNYCRHSAAPVGRYVLDLHGESRTTWPASDALCAALQINNHLQDAASDLRLLDRCYLPQNLLQKYNVSTDDLARDHMVPGLRNVFNNMLTLTLELDSQGAALPGLVKARRLRVETSVIACLAQRLTEKLQAGDPLATRVKLHKSDFVKAALLSAPRLLWN